MRTLILSEAKCKRCGAIFGHADLGSSAYGEVVLSTNDGQQFLVASAWSAFAQRVSAEMPQDSPKSLWQVLAALAEPVNGKPLVHAIVCPRCGSTELDYWGGSKVGSVVCADASFLQSESLSQALLAERVVGLLGCHREA